MGSRFCRKHWMSHVTRALPGLGAVAAAHDNNMGLLSCMLYVQEISAV